MIINKQHYGPNSVPIYEKKREINKKIFAKEIKFDAIKWFKYGTDLCLPDCLFLVN